MAMTDAGLDFEDTRFDDIQRNRTWRSIDAHVSCCGKLVGRPAAAHASGVDVSGISEFRRTKKPGLVATESCPASTPRRATTPGYLALGDSYTIGESVPAAARWPTQLVRCLRRRGVPIDDPRIVAVTGWTTDELSAGMQQAGLASTYALVSLLIGVNDEYRGRSAGNYRHAFRDLLQQAVALANGRRSRVIAVSIPDWGLTPFARHDPRGSRRIADELDVYNAIARDETSRVGARWVDITALSRTHAGLVADDGLHPSAPQYTLWVDAIAPVAERALRGRD